MNKLSLQAVMLCRSLGCVNEVRFAEGVLLSPDSAENIGWGKDLVTSTLEFAAKLADIDVDAVEFAILNGIMLTYPGNYLHHLSRLL